MFSSNAPPPKGVIELGYRWEHLARQIVFDITEWVETFGPGRAVLLHQRQGDDAPYPVAVRRTDADTQTLNNTAGTRILWDVTNVDTAKVCHYGSAELRYYTGTEGAERFLIKRTYQTSVSNALGASLADAPESQSDWLGVLLDAADTVDDKIAAAQSAATDAQSARSDAADAANTAAAAAIAARAAQSEAEAALSNIGVSVTGSGNAVTGLTYDGESNEFTATKGVTFLTQHQDISGKVDKVTGKGLSTNDYTTAEKSKLYGIEAEANKTTIDNTLSVTGNAADAKATGDALAALRNYLASMEVYRMASGNPATFDDGKAVNLKDVTVTITPTQPGSGDPSPTNIRPISGVSSVTVTRTGKNLLPATAWNKTLRQNENYTLSVLSDGAILVDGYIATDNVLIHNMFDEMANTSSGQHDYKKWLPNGQYTLYAEHDGNADVRLQVVTYIDTSNRTLITGNSPQNGALNFTITDQYPYNYVRLFIAAGTYQNLKIYPRIYPADFDADSFEPYQGQSATVSPADSNANPLTVYGGTLDVTTGELTVNVFYTQILSADNALVYNSAYSPQLRRAGFSVNMRNNSAGYCSHFKPYAGGFANIPNMSVLGGSTTIGLRNDALTSLDAWKAWLKAQEDAGTPLQVAWPLAAPVTYQLTPQQLAALSGYNAVSSDAGNVAVTYRANTTLTFEELEHAILSLGGNVS